MKKIAILTWLRNGNYGTILQAYALQRYLRNEGYEVNNIDLSLSFIEKIKNCVLQGNPFSRLVKGKIVSWNTKKTCSDEKTLACRIDKFDEFLKSNFCLSRTFRKIGDLSEIVGKYDAYICGSDQVWNPMLLNPSYYFDFLTDKDKKISYACSFGMNYIPEPKKERIANWLKRYNAISVREDAGLNIVEELTDKKAVVNVDPTMLLNAEEWNQLLKSGRPVAEPYMLCYFLSYNEEQWQKAQNVALEKGLKMVVIPATKESYQKGDKVISDVGPIDWVNLVKHADMVATDSFHGCVFSIIYQRQFMVFKRFSDNNKLSQNSRVYTLLSAYGLENCLVEQLETFQPTEISKAQYDKVLSDVLAKANASKAWLKNAIEA